MIGDWDGISQTLSGGAKPTAVRSNGVGGARQSWAGISQPRRGILNFIRGVRRAERVLKSLLSIDPKPRASHEATKPTLLVRGSVSFQGDGQVVFISFKIIKQAHEVFACKISC